MMSLQFIVLFALFLSNVIAFTGKHGSLHRLHTKLMMSSVQEVTLDIPLGDGFKSLECKFKPIFSKSEFFVSTIDVPFGIDIEKPPRGFPAPIVTKEGKAGEKPGDVLRATTCWSQGFSAAGATSDIAMFAGNIKWRKSVFDTTGAPWDQVVQALVSNTSERSKSVTLVFERELEDDSDTPSN